MTLPWDPPDPGLGEVVVALLWPFRLAFRPTSKVGLVIETLFSDLASVAAKVKMKIGESLGNVGAFHRTYCATQASCAFLMGLVLYKAVSPVE